MGAHSCLTSGRRRSPKPALASPPLIASKAILISVQPPDSTASKKRSARSEGRPQLLDLRQAPLSETGVGFSAVDRIEGNFDLRPAAGFNGVEEALDNVGNGHVLLFGHGAHDITA